MRILFLKKMTLGFCFGFQIKGELPEKEKQKAEDSGSDDDEDKYADEMDMPGTKVSSFLSTVGFALLTQILL